ncbi:hypothetical protein DF3PB_4030002 [uncultured Defluviicoccus sp.]|uniref:Uncharacterized protein n=1 Tax=metagenome TaxID=256318 RepID=A0A380THZ8_9ZZZZ|nr:hypothetical protein DF3PB_4030002 [uncultured Defluviicoccus sp.]
MPDTFVRDLNAMPITDRRELNIDDVMSVGFADAPAVVVPVAPSPGAVGTMGCGAEDMDAGWHRAVSR